MTVYVPAVLVDGVTVPEAAFIDKPAGNAENVPPEVPETAGICPAVMDLQYGAPG